jgi:hypothetical protein
LKKEEKKIKFILEQIIKLKPDIELIHLFCAIPSPLAILIGKVIVPLKYPACQTYNYFFDETPPYSKAIIFNNEK